MPRTPCPRGPLLPLPREALGLVGPLKQVAGQTQVLGPALRGTVPCPPGRCPG